MNRFPRWLLLLACIVPAFFPAPATGESHRPGVLLLTSYHAGDSWNDAMVAGFLAGLPRKAATVYVEHLDTRRFAARGFQDDFARFLAHKYAKIPIRVLVAADDAALDFWLERANALFPGRPLVFGGINDLDPSRLAGRTDITGVLEAPDVLGTLEMALTLLPKVNTIVAVGDRRGPSDRGNLQRFRRAMRALDQRARSVEILDVSPDQAQKALAALPKDAVVLCLGSLRPASGGRLPRGEDAAILAKASPVPVLTLWDYDLGTGALGGRVVTARAQGLAAAAVTTRVLDGQPPAAIPFADAPSQPMVDHNVMERFAISERLLPKGTRILNEPPSTYERHKAFFWTAGVALAVLLPASLMLLLVLSGRQAAEGRLRESERRYRELVECANSLILRFDRDGRVVFVNEYAERLLGYGLDDLPDDLESLRPTGPADLSSLLTRALMDRGSQEDHIAENEVQTRDGRRLIVRWDSRLLRDEAGNGTGWLAVGTDITARRRAEEALAARMLAEEALLAFGRELLGDAPDALPRALTHLLSAFGAGRAVFFENVQDARLGPCCRMVTEVAAHGLAVPVFPAPLPYSLDAYIWANAMEAGETINTLVEEFPERLQEILRSRGVHSLLAAPVTEDGVFCGFVAVADTQAPRRFSRQDKTQLATVASMISAHLARPHKA